MSSSAESSDAVGANRGCGADRLEHAGSEETILEDLGSQPVIFFDGVCELCNAWVHFFARRDPEGKMRFGSLQSGSGRALLGKLGRSTEVLDTVILVEGGELFTHSTAVLRSLRYLKQPWPLFSALRIVPRCLRDGIYRFVARHRYRIFGRRESCMVPPPDLRRRFLD